MFREGSLISISPISKQLQLISEAQRTYRVHCTWYVSTPLEQGRACRVFASSITDTQILQLLFHSVLNVKATSSMKVATMGMMTVLYDRSRSRRELISRFAQPNLDSILDRLHTNLLYYSANYLLTYLIVAILSGTASFVSMFVYSSSIISVLIYFIWTGVLYGIMSVIARDVSVQNHHFFVFAVWTALGMFVNEMFCDLAAVCTALILCHALFRPRSSSSVAFVKLVSKMEIDDRFDDVESGSSAYSDGEADEPPGKERDRRLNRFRRQRRRLKGKYVFRTHTAA